MATQPESRSIQARVFSSGTCRALSQIRCHDARCGKCRKPLKNDGRAIAAEMEVIAGADFGLPEQTFSRLTSGTACNAFLRFFAWPSVRRYPSAAECELQSARTTPMDIRFVSSLTIEDENRLAPAVLQALA